MSKEDKSKRHANGARGSNGANPDTETSQGLDKAARRQITLLTRRTNGNATDILGPARTAKELLSGEVSSPTTVRRRRPRSEKKASAPDNPFGIVNLRMYDPGDRTQIASLISTFVGVRNLDLMAHFFDTKGGGQRARTRDEGRRKGRYISLHPDLDEQKYDEIREAQLRNKGESVKEQVNNHVYDLIKDGLGLGSRREAADMFQTARRLADSAVIEHAALVYPHEKGTRLSQAVRDQLRPADLLEFAFKTADPDEEFAARRQFVTTVLALQEIRGRSRTADGKIEQIQKLFADKLYKNIPVRFKNFYAFFDNNTNRLLTELTTTRPKRSDEKPGSHYKEIRLPVRELKTGGYVVEIAGQKQEGAVIRKGVRLAHERGPEDDTVDISDIKDTYRMNVVVIGNQQQTKDVALDINLELEDPLNQKYFHDRDMVSGKLMTASDGTPIGIPWKVVDMSGTREDNNASRNVNDIKFEVNFTGQEKPARVGVLSAASYIAQQLEVGTYVPGTGGYDGSAHWFYRMRREQSNTSFFPHLRRREGNGKPPQDMARVASGLLKMKRFDPFRGMQL